MKASESQFLTQTTIGKICKKNTEVIRHNQQCAKRYTTDMMFVSQVGIVLA